MDKWFALQATITEEGTLDRVLRLMSHPRFAVNNPNRVRALIGAFATGNPTQFHRADGRGYSFVADTVLMLDGQNPQVSARLLTAFRTWRMLEPARRAKARNALEHVHRQKGLSRDCRDIIERTLG
jgi:aminopeptidase N